MRLLVKHTIAAFVVAAIPAAGFAQSQSAAQKNPAAEHLAAARAALNKVLNAPAPTGDAFKTLSELKNEYIALEKSASTASPDWAAHYSTIDRLVGELIGAPAAASGEAGAVGTAGHTGVMKGVDPGVAANLSTFRTELKAFSTAMSAVAPVANTTAAPAPSASGSAAAAPPAAAQPSAASAAPSATGASGSAVASPAPTGTSGSVVAGTAPRSTPIPAPAPSGTPATAASPSASAGTSPPAESGIAAQIDPVIAMVDAALAASPVDASGKVTIDRATLDAIKAQLQVIKAKKQ
jgi:hypothetical protein